MKRINRKMSQEQKDKISNALKGIKRSQQTKDKQSKAMHDYWASIPYSEEDTIRMTKEKKKQSKKDALAKYGLFVEHFVNLTLLMTDAEYKLLDAIRYYVNNNDPVSNSWLEVTHRITNAKSIAKNRVNLIKLDFIKVLGKTQNGIYYMVLYNNISEILCLLNNEINPIRRLEIADCYRVEHGLDALNINTIKKYKGTNFDTTFCDIESENSEKESKCYESKDAQ